MLSPFGTAVQPPRHPASITNPHDGSSLVLVPAGDYLAGEGEREHIVELDEDFYLGTAPVTNAQYERFRQDTGHRQPCIYGRSFSHPQAPVVGVSWDDAVAYAEWAGLRLPTELEWEKAAVIAADSVQRTDEVAWYRENSGGHPQPVAQLRPNRLGLYDMLGNVWEWTADYYDDEKLYRVVRGGSWLTVADDVRATHRDFNPPVDRMNCIGFRCSRSASTRAS